MRDAAEEASVEIVTGDTKVVQRGKADGLFVNTSGVGSIYTLVLPVRRNVPSQVGPMVRGM